MAGARAACLRFTRTGDIDELMAKHHLDALVSFTNGPARLTDLKRFDAGAHPGGRISPATVAGSPSVTVPSGNCHGLPVGISNYGNASTDAKLLALSADFEACTKERREATFPPSVSVP